MSLLNIQQDFAALVPRLIDHAISLGYQVTLGDAYRDPRVHGAMGVRMSYSHPKSVHKIRLAIDLNLFKNGRYIQDDEGHKELGAWWKQQNQLARWGGDFPTADFNHYSFTFDGNS